jgi:hypothetical protein
MKNQNSLGSALSRLNSKGKKLVMFALLLLGGMLVSSEMQGQQKPTASLSAAGIIQLPSNVALSSAYVFDIASLQFQTEKEAIEFFSARKFDEMVIRPNMTQAKAVLMLDLNKHPGWTVAQWNTLISGLTTAQPIVN